MYTCLLSLCCQAACVQHDVDVGNEVSGFEFVDDAVALAQVIVYMEDVKCNEVTTSIFKLPVNFANSIMTNLSCTINNIKHEEERLIQQDLRTDYWLTFQICLPFFTVVKFC